MSRLAGLLVITSCCLATAACGTRGEPELFSPDQVRHSTAQSGAAVSGYNQPNQYENGIGLRAVADDRLLLISIDNRRDDSIVVGPDMFRLITPDGLRAFERGREDLSGFGIRELGSGQNDVFAVRFPGQVSLVDYALVMNYPPADMIQRVFIEPVGTSSIEIELPPAREPSR